MAMPYGAILSDLFFFLLLPLLTGMGIRRIGPDFAQKNARLPIGVSLIVVVAIVAGALTSGRVDAVGYGFSVPLIIVLFSIGIGALAVGIGFASKFSGENILAIEIEVITRNINLGVLLASSLFSVARVGGEISSGVFYTVLVYGAATMFVPWFPALAFRFGLLPIKPAQD
jgi:BASS family bile acid:Na+ symporter